jgi:hypothetical protein
MLSLQFRNGGGLHVERDTEGVDWKKGTSNQKKVEYYSERGYPKKKIARILSLSLRTVQRYTKEKNSKKVHERKPNQSLRDWLHPKNLGPPRKSRKRTKRK